MRTLLTSLVFTLVVSVCATPQVAAGQSETPWFCQPGESSGVIRWIETKLGRQKIGIVLPDRASQHADLVVFLHADSPQHDPVYQYGLARDIARARGNTIAVAVLRPGYRDSCGDRSDGVRGRTMGDNYTADVVEAVATVLQALQREFNPSRTVIIGHSGGAALSALLASRYPHLQDQSILVACPCNLTRWRQSMMALQNNPTWAEPMAGLSPVDEVSTLDPSKSIHLFVGDEDRVTPPFLSEDYVQTARNAGKHVTYSLVPGGDHDMILAPDILSMILRSIDE